MSLIKHDEELAKRAGFTAAHELATEDKVTYLDQQIEGIKTQLWRSRVDAMLNHAIKTENDTEKAQVAQKIVEHEGNAKRYAEAITLMEQIKSELQ